MVRTLSGKGDVARGGEIRRWGGGSGELGWRRSLSSCLRPCSRLQASHGAFCCCTPMDHTLRHGALYLDDSARSCSRNQSTELISTKPRSRRQDWRRHRTKYHLSITYAPFSRSVTST